MSHSTHIIIKVKGVIAFAYFYKTVQFLNAIKMCIYEEYLEKIVHIIYAYLVIFGKKIHTSPI